MASRSLLRPFIYAVPAVSAGALAAVFALGGAAGLGPGRLLLAAILAAGSAAAELRPVRVAPNQKVSLASISMLLAALLVPPAVAGAAAAAGILAGNLLVGRSLRNSLFNAGSAALATLAAAVIAGGARLDPAGFSRMLLAALLFSATSFSLASTAAALQKGDSISARLAATISANWSQALAFAALAVSVAGLAETLPLMAPVPLLLLPLVFRMNVALESELTSNERLQAVLEGQRRFLTDVSHNVGNPLATIRTNLSLIARAPLRPSQRIALQDGVEEATRLAELFKRLRVLAETDEGVPLKRQRVDLAEIANDLVRAYTGEAARRGVELSSEAVAGAAVDGDAELIRQAAANLVENALRLTPSGRAVKLRVGLEQTVSCLEVIDEGPGIREEELGSIFERFKKGPGGGSGLGLAIARSVVERHGGRIWVDTRLGAGSRFQIRLPSAN